MCRFWIPVVVVILVLSPHLWLSAAGPPVDQDKLLWAPPYILFYADTDIDAWHDAGEAWSTVAWPWMVPTGDRSCWMASASNLLVHGGCANPCTTWIGSGGASSPNWSVWRLMYWADGIGGDAAADSMTFDDGGWQDWALTFVGAALQGPIMANPEFGGGGWMHSVTSAPVNPITWCQGLLTNNIPVGLTCWWGDIYHYEETGPGPMDQYRQWGYHAITLWNITGGSSGTMQITDSDDFGMMGHPLGTPRTIPYTFAPFNPAGMWNINLYPGVTATVNYAVAIAGDPPTSVEPASWSSLKALYR
ncbi:MAG: hypothetical protein KAW17_03745 [Candidatus Eisenbacteria sp.]|nr:hypothetical protein [Candidatus Eisenbacteria bacterium]